MNNKTILKVTSSILLCTMTTYCSAPVLAYTKDETVYSKVDTTGSNYSTIVNSHIINSDKESTLYDLSDLTNIKNVNGDESFTQDGTNLVWNSNGSDIYYQGESQKELPIECQIKYELDGKEISAEELAGKSGKVKITIKYINKDEHVVNINGKNEKLYTPFTIICGTVLDNKNNSNIEISSGKVVDDGTKTTVLGIAMPGLMESLDISKDKLDIPDTIEITMEATDFELSNLITFVTPKLLEDSDLEIFDDLDDIYNKVNTLESSSKELENGANTLKTGTDTYLEKSKEFNSAVKELSAGVNSASTNYLKIDNGISTLNKNSSTLVNGAKQVSDGTKAIGTNLKTVSKGLGDLKTGTKSLQSAEKEISSGLDRIIKSLDQIDVSDNSTKISELNALVSANKQAISALEAVNSSLDTQYKLANSDSKADKEIRAGITKQKQANNSAIAVLKKDIEANNETIATLKKTDMSEIKTLKDGLNQLKQAMSQLQSGTKTLLDGETDLKTGTDTLYTKTQELATGSAALYQGTLKIANGTETLNSGSTELKKGLSTLDKGSMALANANDMLTEGASTVSEGVTTLANGIGKFNKEGIQTICNYVNKDLKDMQTKIEKLQDLAEEYNNFSMLNKDSNGNVKFIMIMDGIKKNEDSKEKAIIDNKGQEN